MPQGRRKVPFSAKQKKLQLQNKRKRKANVDGKLTSYVRRFYLTRTWFRTPIFILLFLPAGDSQEEENVKKINEQPLKNDRSNVNR